MDNSASSTTLLPTEKESASGSDDSINKDKPSPDATNEDSPTIKKKPKKKRKHIPDLDTSDDDDSVSTQSSTRKSASKKEAHNDSDSTSNADDAVVGVVARSSPPGKSRKAKSQRRRRDEQHRVKALMTCAIQHSDQSESEFDFGTFAITPLSNTKWKLPTRDFWEPQDAKNMKFRVETKRPELTHRLTQLEIFAQFPSTTKPLPLGRIKILQQAIWYKTNTDVNRRNGQTRYNDVFQQQDYVDFACVMDQNRPIAVEHQSYRPETGMVAVHISSYKLPSNATLESLRNDRHKRRLLVRAVQRVDVDLQWLRSTCRPEVTKVLDEMVLGSKVMRVRGANIGTADALSLSFSGSAGRVQGFLSLPQGQKIVEYRVEQPEPPDPKNLYKREIWYDSQHQVTDRMRKVQKNSHLEFNLPYAPPPPKDTTQIVKLKWLPSKKGKPRAEEGIWHGLFAVDVGVSESNTTLQECSLTKDWVETAFSLAFRRECKNIATKATTKRNANKYLFIPAGDSRNGEDDLPPTDELLTDVRVHYQQGKLDSCLRHSMSSAIHTMGFIEEAKDLALEESISGSTVGLVERAAQFVRKRFKQSNLVMKKVFSTACSVDQVTQEDSSWPMLLIIQTSDGIYGSHAITTWNGMIFDSTCPNALRWSQRSLDWSSGLDSTCIGFSRVYRLCPEDYGRMLPDCTFRVGTQLRSHSVVTNAFGWVRRLPTQKKNGQQKKGYIICYLGGGIAELSQSDVAKYVIKK